MKTQPYITPSGTYDLPFFWIFDASGFADGTNQPNSSIYLQGGYGDFQLRRIVGMDRFLAADGTGKFQIQRASKGSYIQSDPVQAPNSPELAITPEEPYLETGKIWFDLYGISKPAGQPLSSLLGFQGVRRMKGNPPPQPDYQNFPKSYSYQLSGTLTEVASAGVPVVSKLLITDYDFELHQILLFQQKNASATLAVEGAATIILTALIPGPGGDSISIQMGAAPGNNLPFSISVIGTTINVLLATDGGGLPTLAMTGDFVAAQMNADPAVAALVTTIVIAGTLEAPTAGPVNLSGGVLEPITTPVCSLYVYDQNKVRISNLPVLDIFFNGAPGSPYENGAIVPPLFYRKESILEIDFYSQITDASLLPTSVVVYLVGKKLYPCA